MQLNILIVGVLFPAIPLMMINFGNRYSLLSSLIRNLHDTVINDNISTADSTRFFDRLLACANVCGWLQSSRLAVRLPSSWICRRWFRFILGSRQLAAGFSSCRFSWWSRRWSSSPSKSRSLIQRLMCIYQIWKNIKSGRIIWHHQNRVAGNLAKPFRRHRQTLHPNLRHGWHGYFWSFLRCK